METLTARKGMEVGTTDPEEQALVRAICANPFDDLPRLRMADWLEERGESERSEFVRVQIELAKCRPDCGPGRICRYIGESTCIDLRKRQDELWYRPAKGFDPTPIDELSMVFTIGTADETNPKPQAVVRRGFISKLQCTLRDFMGGECARCRGRGRLWVRGYENRATPIVQADEFASCRYCNGTGRTPGLVDTIFRVQPVTEVVLSQSSPIQLQCDEGNVFHWMAGRRIEPESPHFLGQDLYDVLDLPSPHIGGELMSGKYASTLGESTSARDAACIALGRKRAGLLPI